MRLLKKIKASALQFAILVATIIAILLGSFLTLTYTHSYFNTQSEFLLSTIEKANQGIDFSLLPDTVINDSISIQNNGIQTRLTKQYWGAFEKITATASIKKKSFSKMALIGSALSNPATALYLADDNLPLVVVGTTKIEGKAYIPTSGVKPGVISGNYFYGTKPIIGSTKPSSSSLPRLEPAWENYINAMASFVPSANSTIIPQKPEAHGSFFQTDQIIYNNEPIHVTENYTGNILIKSERAITLSSESKLEDALLIAPIITIEKGFSGTLHCIAEKQIIIEEQVNLEYPSSLVVMGKINKENSRLPSDEIPVSIGTLSKISGSLVYLGNEKSQNEKSRIHIDLKTNSMIKGMIFCRGNIQLNGTVKGTVYTEHFIAKEAGSRYINHIYNGTILANALHPKFSGLPFVKTKKEIAKWLY